MRFVVPVLLVAASASFAQSNVPVEARIAIQETQAAFVVTVPVSRIELEIPKGELRVARENAGGAASSPRYFLLAGPNMRVSGWFEPAQRYSDIQASWRTEMAGLARNGVGQPSDVETLDVAGMQAIVYILPVPPGTNYHLRGSYLGAGTWVDLHLSINSSEAKPEARAQLLELARGLAFRQKP